MAVNMKMNPLDAAVFRFPLPAEAKARLIGLRMHACTANQHKSTWRILQSP